MALFKNVELFLMNRNFKVLQIIDDFKSFLWVERFCDFSEFEIYLQFNQSVISNIRQDYYVYYKESDHLMIIENIRIITDADDGDVAVITGRSLESILDRRIVWDETVLDGTLENGVKKLITDAILEPKSDIRKIPGFSFINTNIGNNYTYHGVFLGQTLFEAIKTMCEENSVGFKITWNQKTNGFEFRLYPGVDRSYSQTKNTYVIFSHKFDNLLDSNYYISNENLKETALIDGEEKENENGEKYRRRETYRINMNGNPGLDRREVYIEARDISSRPNSEEVRTQFIDPSGQKRTWYFNGVTLEDDGEGRVTASGEPTITGVVFDFHYCTIKAKAYEMRGKLRLSGAPKTGTDEDVESNYIFEVYVKSGSSVIFSSKNNEPHERDILFGKTDMTDISYDVYLKLEIKNGTNVQEDRMGHKSFNPKLEFFELLDSDYRELLLSKGRESLLIDHSVLEEYEGNVDFETQFIYKRHYFLGDIVQVENPFGLKGTSRVTEISTSIDSDGFKLSPVFSALDFN